MREKISLILESALSNEEKADELHELFKKEATEACMCVIKGFINGGE